MFYRRKVILALLQVFEDELDKIHFQKLLFLFTRKQVKPEYDFVPYKFGCFSFSANADIVAMERDELLIETETIIKKTDETDFLKQLKPADLNIMLEIKAVYGVMSVNAVMKHTYLEYPYYAINSEVAEKKLSSDELEIVRSVKTAGDKTVLFTIGYEGISLEEYLNRLLINDIKLLVDVRKNALSMKYGFSKSKLLQLCESLKIEYIHLPEVGIDSDRRQELNGFEDYRKLFEEYKKNNLSRTLETQLKILELLVKKKRIALTCFEADPDYCHRKHLAEAISRLKGFNYEVKHI